MTSTHQVASPRSPRSAPVGDSHVNPRSKAVFRHLSDHGYMLREQLSGGNYGTIHMGVSKIAREPVIIKELDVSNSNREFALREADMMSALSHPHIVKLHDRVEVDDRLFLAMQLARGGDLHDHVTGSANGMLSVSDSKRIFAQMILGLEHMHKRHIVHMDIKPDNVFLDSNNNVLIGDFGLSDRFNPKHRSMVARGGTLHYSAPESFLGSMIEGPELDVWSAGAVLYVMMRGRYPFWGETDQEIAKAIMFTEPLWPEWFPSEAIDLLNKMLVKNPRHRISLSKIKRHPFIQREIRHWKRCVSHASP